MAEEVTDSPHKVAGELSDELEQTLEDAIEMQLAPAAERRVTYIDDLDDAVEFDVTNRIAFFKPKPGQHVVVEKWVTISGTRRWLGTILYRVDEVDTRTGNVKLFDEENMQSALANFVTAPLKHGWRFKLPVPKLNLHAREKAGFLPPGREPPSAPTDTDPGTGHPGPADPHFCAGDKGKRAPRRPKEVIEAEKKARFQRGIQRRLKREARQRGERV